MTRAFASLLLAGMLTFPACGSGVLTEPSAILGASWKLQSIETSAGLAGVNRPDAFTLTFNEGGRLGIKADCNVCGGTYAVSGDELTVSGVFCTLAYCGDASQDRVFLSIVDGSSRFGVRGIELSIQSSEGTIRLTR